MPDPDLKYRDELKLCSDQPCPNPRSFQRSEKKVCYRFLHGESAHERDFVPFPLTPHGQTTGAHGRPCEHWALSFFDSLEAARKRWHSLAERVDAASRYGTHVGEIELTKDDGLLGPPKPKAGHLSLHEFDSVAALAPRVKASAPVRQSGASPAACEPSSSGTPPPSVPETTGTRSG